MTYPEATDFLFHLEKFGMRLGLERIQELLNFLGNPQREFPAIHIAGTNGKGSTAAMLESILSQAGYKTGLYTSPHLMEVEERILVSGVRISREQFVQYTELLRSEIQRLRASFFEALTAMAFYHFAQEKVQVAVVEVGMGGRLDATNVVQPLLTLITSIDLDHIEHLGNTIEKIAREKGGIIKKGVDCLTSCRQKEALRILEKMCQARQARFENVRRIYHPTSIKLTEENTQFDLKSAQKFFPELTMPLVGSHQVDNAILATAAANRLLSHQFQIDEEDLYRGLSRVYWPGRLEKLNEKPKLVIDVAHNPGGIAVVSQALQDIFQYPRLILIMGVLQDKDYKEMIKRIVPLADLVIAVKPDNPRALEPRIFATEACRYTDCVKIIEKVDKALEFALDWADVEDLICATGSHYTVGEIIKCYRSRFFTNR